jgi:hypothetical protein
VAGGPFGNVRALNLEALAARAAALGADRRLRIVIAVIGFVAVTIATALIAHPRMFTGFANYDDEGYMLTALKGFVNHGELYDRVFTQYGPFYYEFWDGVFQVFGLSVNHDNGRTVTEVVWVLSGLLLGLSLWRMTGSIVIGLATQILGFAPLFVLTNEPMHPVGIIALLLSTIVLISTFVRERESPYVLALLGAAVAALFLVKVNVGAFAIISTILACVVSYPVLWQRKWLRYAIEALFVLIPVLLMYGKFDMSWARHYAFHVAVSALAVVFLLHARPAGRRVTSDLRWLVGGFLVLAIISCVAVLGAGTSIHGLIDGVIKQPLRQADAFSIPFGLSKRMYAFDFVGLGAAATYWFAARYRTTGAPSGTWRAIWAVFAIVVGVTMIYAVPGQSLPFNANTLEGFPISMLPFCWVALIPLTPEERAPSFARLLLPLLAVLQSLHGYPVAGSQIQLSALLLVPVGALCVGNGMRGLFTATELSTDRIALVGLATVAVVVLGWFTVNVYLKEQITLARGNYNAGFSLNLPGSSKIHLGSEEEVAIYQGVVHAIDRDCSATVMEPGMDSFYLWSEQEPPSYTATGWETLFDTEHQEKVIEDTRGDKQLCLLHNPGLQAGWGEKEGILTEYLEQGFKPIGKWGEYELLRREGPYKGSL